MPSLGIALDLGTSGFRGQVIDLSQDGRIITTVVTTRHPIPGANVIDHLHFALEVGVDEAHLVMLSAVNRVIDKLLEKMSSAKKQVKRLAVCGNPIQLSLFQAIEIRDLAYAGKRKLDALGVNPPQRDAQRVKAKDISGLDLPADTVVIIPPAVQHEIGADALAMMIQTGLLKSGKIAVVTDYGTNNEMALLANGVVYTGSTAAGPALEGQHIQNGLLALPGAIADVEFVPDPEDNPLAPGHRNDAAHLPVKGFLKCFVLDDSMTLSAGDTVDPESGAMFSSGDLPAVGITGTGVVALIERGLNSRLIRIPRINTPDETICLANGIRFYSQDLQEAGKAIGAVRAGHITLCQEAGINPEDIEIAYCSGASGTYVDARKAQCVGMIPPQVKKIYQVGNTSLAMARELVCDDNALFRMKQVADQLRQHHCMFASSKVFEKVYILELAYWTEGMPISQYQKFLARYGLPALKPVAAKPEIIKTVQRDIPDLGEKGLQIIDNMGSSRSVTFPKCAADMACVRVCPESALNFELQADITRIEIDLSLCNGVACRRCERVCKEKVFNLVKIITGRYPPGDVTIRN